MSNYRIRDIKTMLREILQTSKFPGILPKTLAKSDLNILKESNAGDIYYLLKSDGDRRLVFILECGTIYLIDRNMYITKFDKSFVKDSLNAKIVLDAELVSIKGNKHHVDDNVCLRVFDVLVLNGISLEKEPFTERILTLTNFLTNYNEMYAHHVESFIKISHPNKITDILKNKHCDINGQIIDKLKFQVGPSEAVTGWIPIDGIVLMTGNSAYVRGTSVVCSKYKNVNQNTIDFQILSVERSLMNERDGFICSLGVFDQKLRHVTIPFDSANYVFFDKDLWPGTFDPYKGNTLTKHPCVGQIIECYWSGSEGKWLPYKIRHDKKYPNSLTTSLNVWDTIINPINILSDFQVQNDIPAEVAYEAEYKMPLPHQSIVVCDGNGLPPRSNKDKQVVTSKIIKPGIKNHNGNTIYKINGSNDTWCTVIDSSCNIPMELYHKIERQKRAQNIALKKEFNLKERLLRLKHLRILSSEPAGLCDVPSVPKKGLPALGSQELDTHSGHKKLSDLLNTYLENFDPDSNYTSIEVEFRFQCIVPESGDIKTEISSEFANALLNTLKNNKPDRLLTVDFFFGNPKEGLRASLVCKNEEEAMSFVKESNDWPPKGRELTVIKKKKLRICSEMSNQGSDYFNKFSTGVSEYPTIKGSVSIESKVSRGFLPKDPKESSYKRIKDRYSFKYENYVVDLTHVKTVNTSQLDTKFIIKEHWELEVELVNLDSMQKLEEIFSSHNCGEPDPFYMKDIFSGLLNLINIFKQTQRETTSEKSAEKNKPGIKGGGDGNFLREHGICNSTYWQGSSTSQVVGDIYISKAIRSAKKIFKHIISNPYLKLNDQFINSVCKLSYKYFEEMFEINRKDGGVIRGKSKLAIMFTIAYFALIDSGHRISIACYVKEVVNPGGICRREFIKTNGVVEKYINRSNLQGQIDLLITTLDYVQKIIQEFSPISPQLVYYRTHMDLLVKEIESLQNDVDLLKLRCNEIGILVIYFHVKFGINIDSALELCQTKIPRATRWASVSRMKILLTSDTAPPCNNTSGSPKKVEKTEEVQAGSIKVEIPIKTPTEVSELKLNLLTISSKSILNLSQISSKEELAAIDINKLKNIRGDKLCTELNELKTIHTVAAPLESHTTEARKQLGGEGTNPTWVCVVKKIRNILDKHKILFVDIDGMPGISELIMSGEFQIINLHQLFEHFICTDKFICIRYGDKTKTYKNMPEKKIKQKTEKMAHFKTFQNNVQITLRFPDSDISPNKTYDIKVFGNGKYTITGCIDTIMPTKISNTVIAKINETKECLESSELSSYYKKTVYLPNYCQAIKYSNINASAKSNIQLTPSTQDQFGLKKLFNIIKSSFSQFLVSETHADLKSNQMPIYLPDPELKSGKRLIFKINSPYSYSITTIQIHKSGSINLSGKSEKDLKYAYELTYKIIEEFHRSNS